MSSKKWISAGFPMDFFKDWYQSLLAFGLCMDHRPSLTKSSSKTTHRWCCSPLWSGTLFCPHGCMFMDQHQGHFLDSESFVTLLPVSKQGAGLDCRSESDEERSRGCRVTGNECARETFGLQRRRHTHTDVMLTPGRLEGTGTPDLWVNWLRSHHG